MNSTRAVLLGICCLGSAAVAAAQNLPISFSLLPSTGTLYGNAGDTVGWGYSITNPDPNLTWMASDLNSGPIVDATSSVLFDFPIIGPGQTVTEAFDPVNFIGLFQLTWNMDAPLGALNQGLFIVSGDWYSGDPTVNGVFVATAANASASYSALLGSPAPEPAPAVSLALGLAILFFAARSVRMPPFVRRPGQK
ncbi:MAG: hypothetical protein KGN84_16285 [Acidobacteriota bacterium]|nr:hypothetical protein [Acidobacteriota bacterium]